jgi:hypothetical protein
MSFLFQMLGQEFLSAADDTVLRPKRQQPQNVSLEYQNVPAIFGSLELL